MANLIGMSPERPRWYRRRLIIVPAALVALLVCAAGVFALTRPGDVFNADVEFQAEEEPTTVPTPPPAEELPGKNKKSKKKNVLSGFQWPTYGYTLDRRRYLPTDASVRPPFKNTWTWKGPRLLEFPPIITGDRLYTLDNEADAIALDRVNGKVVWKRKIGHLAASSPTFGAGKVYFTVLERASNVRAGRVVALDAKTGKVEWSRKLASRSESSPIFVDGRIYFGAEDGTVYAMRANDGSTQWRFHAGGAVKGGPALSDGKLYFGTYGGNVYAISQRTGKQVWHTGTSGATFGLSAGNFYSSPAVAYGRVFIGNTDGNMYSFGAETGRLAWRRKTSSYVYASPAVAQVKGTKPTVYFGSYDGTFYALDAVDGSTFWTHRDGGKISGAASVIGDIVYYSNWGNRDTRGLWAKTGGKAWYSERGAFNPVVSDGQTIYLTGFQSVGAFVPKTKAEQEATKKRLAAEEGGEPRRSVRTAQEGRGREEEAGGAAAEESPR